MGFQAAWSAVCLEWVLFMHFIYRFWLFSESLESPSCSNVSRSNLMHSKELDWGMKCIYKCVFMQQSSIHFNETKLIPMNNIKQSKTDCLLSHWGVYPQISKTSYTVLPIWTWSLNAAHAAPSPPPWNADRFSIHLISARLKNQLIIARTSHILG